MPRFDIEIDTETKQIIVLQDDKPIKYTHITMGKYSNEKIYFSCVNLNNENTKISLKTSFIDLENKENYQESELINKHKVGGIYKITNIVNNKFYIGSTVSFLKRGRNHLYHLKNKQHRNKYLQNSWNKYGEGSFIFEILEIYQNPTKELLMQREQWHIDNSNCCDPNIGYNLSKNVYRCNLGVERSEEFKKQMSKLKKGKRLPHSKEWCKNISNSRLGHTVSEQTREKIRNSLKGAKSPNYGKSPSKETIAKMSLARTLYYQNKRELYNNTDKENNNDSKM